MQFSALDPTLTVVFRSYKKLQANEAFNSTEFALFVL
jgi:hypothetical protein